MNRAERRKLAKGKVDHRDLRAIEVKAGLNGVDYAVEKYSAAVALACRDKLGFGKMRTQRFIRQVWEIFSDIDKGYLTLNDVLETIKTELDIELRD